MLLSELQSYIKSGQTKWYTGTIPKLVVATSNYANIHTTAVLSIKYTGNSAEHSIRCQNALTDAGTFQIWLYSGASKPTTAIEDTTGTIKIDYANKTPQRLATEINQLKNWEATCLYDCPRLDKGELWNYFGDYTYTFPRSSTGWWTNYTGCTYSPERSFTGEYIIRANRFVALYDHGSALEVYDPGTVNIYSPWYFRINPGYFRLVNSTGSYLYGVPEYNSFTGWSQSLGKPYITIQLSVPLKIDESLIYVQHKDIRNVVVYIDGKPDYSIKRIFRNHGIIEMSSPIAKGKNVSVSYDYLERFYLYKGLNLNPRLNTSVLNKYIILYATPQTSIESGASSTSTSCIHHATGSTLNAAYSAITATNAVILTVAKFMKPTGYSYLDLRTPGGGALDVDNIDTIQPDSACYTDISSFCGFAYPGNGSIIISVPNSVDISDIPERLSYYLASGIDYIIRKRA